MTLEATYLPETSLASPDVDVKHMLVAAGTNPIPALTPMKRDTNKKLVPATSGVDAIVGLLVPLHGSGYIELLGLPGNRPDTLAGIYTEAKVYDGAIYWDFIEFANASTIDTNEKKQACFDLTGVDVIFNTAGF
jgi:hypothetical protein